MAAAWDGLGLGLLLLPPPRRMRSHAGVDRAGSTAAVGEQDRKPQVLLQALRSRAMPLVPGWAAATAGANSAAARAMEMEMWILLPLLLVLLLLRVMLVGYARNRRAPAPRSMPLPPLLAPPCGFGHWDRSAVVSLECYLL